MEEVRVLCPIGMLGGGFQEEAFFRAVDLKPHVIAADGGSTDSGPWHLGAGKPKPSRDAVKRDLRLMMIARQQLGVPLIVGSCGTSGIDAGVDWTRDICLEIAAAENQHFKLALVYSEQDKEYLKSKFREGRIKPLKPAPHLDEAVIDRCSHIVGMMGHEPIAAALDAGADVVLAGRATDTALMAVMPLRMGAPAGPTWHAAKTMECGAACTEGSHGGGGVFVRIDEEGFIIEPCSLRSRCTPSSIAGHTLYENSDPYYITEPSGLSDTTKAHYFAVDDRTVKVTGSEFIAADQYTVKLEAAEPIGYETVAIGGVRDPYILRELESWTASMKGAFEHRVKQLYGHRLNPEDVSIDIRLYGYNAVMGDKEPLKDRTPHEVGILFIVRAPDQATATDIAKFVSHGGSHFPVSKWTGGLISGIAYPFSPPEIERGPAYRFAMNHVVEIDDPCEMVRFKYLDV